MKIDFVVAWVDGNDSDWQKKRKAYKEDEGDSSPSRYRDWEIFKYWFRSVEKNAPWVNKIFLVTDHQIPEFLDISNPKLEIVFHEDYIPQEYLPTFSANPIELNFHRIKNLSEHFVYFNDDMFLNKKVYPEDFFIKSKPCYSFIERPWEPHAPVGMINHICFNDMGVVNNFHFRKELRRKIRLYLSLKYGKHALKNLLLLPQRTFQHFEDNHMACPFLKSTLEDVWNKAEDVLDATSKRRFRTHDDVNQYLFKYWDLARGNFSPYYFQGGYYSVNETNVNNCTEDILHQTHKLICINDEVPEESFVKLREEVKNAFEKRYAEKSSFEV